MKRILILLSFVLLFLLGCSSEFKVDVKDSSKEMGQFKLTSFDGKNVSSKSIFKNGKPTLFVFAAEWCPYCQDESPYIQEFYEKNGNDVNIVVVYINSNTTLEKSKEYLDSNGYTYPAYFDKDNVIANAFGVKSIPTNFKIENNKIVKQIELPVDMDKLELEFLKK